MLRIAHIVPRSPMAARTLGTIDMRAGLKDILAGAERSSLGISRSIRAFSGRLHNALSNGSGASTTATGSGPNRRYRNSPAATATTPSKKPRKTLPKPPPPLFFAICDALLRKLLPCTAPETAADVLIKEMARRRPSWSATAALEFHNSKAMLVQE